MRLAGWLSRLVLLAAVAGIVAPARGQEAPATANPALGQEVPPTAAPALDQAVPPATAPAPAQEAPVTAPVTDAGDGYGRRHSLHLGLSLGVGNGTGGMRYAGGVGFGYFIVTGVAPGADVSINGGSGVLTTESVTGTLRLVPIRTGQFALFLIGRAGRLFMANHADAWAAGGGAGVVIATGTSVGLQLSYEVLGLWPASHCSDLASGCRLDAFGLGLVMGL